MESIPRLRLAKAVLCRTQTPRAVVCIVLSSLALGGCSLGMTKIDHSHYLAVPSEKNVNYFRIRVTGRTKLGKTSYRSGWYPAAAVDSLYGDASQSGASAAYKLEEDLKSKINDKILATADGYLNAAADPKADPGLLEAWLAAQRRVRAFPGDEVPLPNGAVEIEYQPGANLALRHSGEKLIFVLSSDPDEVIGAISNFSQNVETGATVLRLADVIRQRSVDEVAATEARNAARGKTNEVLVQRIDSLQAVTEKATRTELTREIESLRILLENLR